MPHTHQTAISNTTIYSSTMDYNSVDDRDEYDCYKLLACFTRPCRPETEISEGLFDFIHCFRCQ